MEKQADINIRPNELEALKEAEVIRLTDGQEFVRKDVASKIMAKYAQQELQAYRDIIKELIPIAESHLCSAEYGYNSEEYCAKLRDIIKRSNKLIDTVTPT